MSSEMKTRFRSAEEALRFFFRLRELLYDGRPGRLLAGELPVSACATAANAIDDYQCIGSCMRGLNDVALWLLSEIYGPTSFGVHRRSLAHVCKAARLEFPERELRLSQVRMIHELALGAVKQGMRELGMISARRTGGARKRHRGMEALDQMTHLLISQAADR